MGLFFAKLEEKSKGKNCPSILFSLKMIGTPFNTDNVYFGFNSFHWYLKRSLIAYQVYSFNLGVLNQKNQTLSREKGVFIQN